MILHTRILISLSSFLHLVIGVHELLVDEPLLHKASAWQVLFRYGVPEPLWNLAFVVVGMLLIAGFADARVARLAFRISAGVFILWALGSWISWQSALGATFYQTLALAYAGLLQWGIADAWLVEHELANKVETLDQDRAAVHE